MTRMVVVCDAVLFFAMPVLVLPWLIIAEARAEQERLGPERRLPERVGPEPTVPALPSAAIQALFLGLRGVFCVAVAPALARSPAHLVLLASSLAHQGLAAAALALVTHLASLHRSSGSGGSGNDPVAGSEASPSDLVGFCNGLAFVGVVYVFSLAFGLRAAERWLRGMNGDRRRMPAR